MCQKLVWPECLQKIKLRPDSECPEHIRQGLCRLFMWWALLCVMSLRLTRDCALLARSLLQKDGYKVDILALEKARRLREQRVEESCESMRCAALVRSTSVRVQNVRDASVFARSTRSVQDV